MLTQPCFQIPGGNTSEFDGCATQWGVPNSTFGINNEGVQDRMECDSLPEPLKPGCYWYWDWLKGVDRPE